MTLGRLGIVLPMLALLACGSGPRDSSLALRSYYDGIAAGRWEAACEMLTDAARQKVREDFGGSCPRALARARPGASLLSTARVASADIDGPRARVEVILLGSDPARPRMAVLERVGGRWLVANPYSPFRRPLQRH